jgi:hypothetical protein
LRSRRPGLFAQPQQDRLGLPAYSTRSRAAASSIASGRPSSRWQICATAAMLCRVNANSGATERARSVNSDTASTKPMVNAVAYSPDGRDLADQPRA